MGTRHLLLLLIYLDPLSVLGAATGGKKPKQPARKPPKATAVPTVVPPKTPQPAPASNHDTCLGYYDVSGQYDKLFECNNTDYRYCCGTCYLRFCCEYKKDRLDQKACTNYISPVWLVTLPPSPIPTGETYDPSMDQTNTAVYITCGIIAFIIVLGVSAKVAYDKATEPPQEMNIHRALADILRQQGPIPISQYDCENFAAMNGSPKDNTPVRTSSKNHYTPVHTSKSNHGLHYGKESVRSSGGADLHNFISSGFVTLGRGHPKGTHQHNYNHVALGSPTRTPKNAHRSLRRENNRISGILTSQTEPYDLSFSRSFQSLSHLPPSYEAAVKADLSRFSSLKKLTDKDVEDYYTRKRHLPDLAARGTLPLHVLKISQDQHREQQQQLQSQPPQSSISQAPPQPQSSQQQSQQRQRPRRVQRAMSQDRVLSPQSAPQQDYSMSSNGMSPYGGRILSDEQLLSAERLRSQERLLPQDRHHTSQDRLYSKDRIYSKDRLLSQDHLYSKDRHYSQDRLYSQERLYSQDRLLSQDPLLSPDKLMMSLKRGMVSSISGGFRGSDMSMSRAISHTDVFIPTTPLMDRYKMTKMHSHPSASNNGGGGASGGGGSGHSNTLSMNQTATKRQAFASRRTHTVEQLHYIPQHHQQQQQQPQHYRTGSKTEVTV
ncbi:protein shisa-6 isoform X4 [Sparus aurata]|uniref:Shisa family member 6 n=1 Tax=Sparus aurata TaxID=8175 RepID=A0A671VXT5_SPAAU|nr:protein shisa-6-like isoform X4 [Sparus aurata]